MTTINLLKTAGALVGATSETREPDDNICLLEAALWRVKAAVEKIEAEINECIKNGGSRS